MRSSDQINELAAALAAVQGKLKPALKDSENPAFKTGGKVSKYADLTSVWEACRDELSKNGIAVVQAHDASEAGDVMITRLVHKSGQWVESQYPIRPVANTPQGFASATTYARRISLASMVGVVADDDDGNEASGAGTPAKPRVVANNDAQAAAQPASMVGRKNEAEGIRKAREWVNAEALPAVAACKTAEALNVWAAETAKTRARVAELVPDDAAALDHRIKLKAESFNILAAG